MIMKQQNKILLKILVAVILLVFASKTYAGTLETIQERGYLKCGVGHNDFGFAEIDENGIWQGFDVDFCRAIASATLGSASAVQFITVDSQSRLPALINNEIDVLLRTTTWTFSRDVGLPIEFAAIILFDHQKIISSAELNISTLKDANNETICVNKGTTSLHNIKNYLKWNNLDMPILKLETQEGRWNAFLNGRCNLMTSDYFDLYAGIQTLAPKPDEIHFLKDNISEEPLSVTVRDDDPNWLNIVRWVINITILAEQDNITQSDTKNNASSNPNVIISKILDETNNMGKMLGLSKGWTKNILSSVGNYGEIYNRNLGSESKFKIERGLNEIWHNGGMIYAPPFR